MGYTNPRLPYLTLPIKESDFLNDDCSDLTCVISLFFSSGTSGTIRRRIIGSVFYSTFANVFIPVTFSKNSFWTVYMYSRHIIQYRIVTKSVRNRSIRDFTHSLTHSLRCRCRELPVVRRGCVLTGYLLRSSIARQLTARRQSSVASWQTESTAYRRPQCRNPVFTDLAIHLTGCGRHFGSRFASSAHQITALFCEKNAYYYY